jgi:hypothetical protein
MDTFLSIGAVEDKTRTKLSGAIDLAEQASQGLSSTKLSLMNQALKVQPREEKVELRLGEKEAYRRLREGDKET